MTWIIGFIVALILAFAFGKKEEKNADITLSVCILPLIVLIVEFIIVGSSLRSKYDKEYNSIIPPAEEVEEYVIGDLDEDINEIEAHEWVDLGLPSGTKWATMNVGASSPSDYGSYFAWGETSPKSSYTWENLRYRTSGDSYDNVKFSKYVTNSMYGTVDGKKELELSDDAAHVNWGSGWRMPSASQIDELKSNCTYTWTTMNGKSGYKVTSKKNGNSIFLPAAGYRLGSSPYSVGSNGYYWSRSLRTDYGWNAYYLDFYSGNFSRNYNNRRYGQSVRPVRVSE